MNENGKPISQPEDCDVLLTALALSQLSGTERLQAEKLLKYDSEAVRQVETTAQLGLTLRELKGSVGLPSRSIGILNAVDERLQAMEVELPSKRGSTKDKRTWLRRFSVIEWCVVGAMVCLLVGLMQPADQSYRESARRTAHLEHPPNSPAAVPNDASFLALPESTVARTQLADDLASTTGQSVIMSSEAGSPIAGHLLLSDLSSVAAGTSVSQPVTNRDYYSESKRETRETRFSGTEAIGRESEAAGQGLARGLGGINGDTGVHKGIPRMSDVPGLRAAMPRSDTGGAGMPAMSDGMPGMSGGMPGMSGGMPGMSGMTVGSPVGKSATPGMGMAGMPGGGGGLGASRGAMGIGGETFRDYYGRQGGYGATDGHNLQAAERAPGGGTVMLGESRRWSKERLEQLHYYEHPTDEKYAPIVENAFLPATSQPLSTFSIDVDTASYANVRRFLSQNQMPPRDAVRIEELVNYFSYNYPPPTGDTPFAANMEVAECPWSLGNRLVRIGLKGREIQKVARPASNLVFLLDVSGSMSDQNKLPLLKQAMELLVNELTENDRVTIVTYAGEAGLRLDTSHGEQKQRILSAIHSLSAGGSTNGSAGIELAYDKAVANFIAEGTNRVILATDGDLNVGITSDDALIELIAKQAKTGVFLTVLGFGEGNLKDAKLEKLADHGNGVYAYIDGLREARKVFVEQMTGSLITIAKDVKIQIEFNPAEVQAYRLIGYENRLLAARDFDNDAKDAGEIGAGHTVTALYEIVPVRRASPVAATIDPATLKYQRTPEALAAGQENGTPLPPAGQLSDAAKSGELLTLALRFKQPDGRTSVRREFALTDRGQRFSDATQDFQFAAAVAEFGLLLRASQYCGSATISAVEEIASSTLEYDPHGYRAEFLDLVRRARKIGVPSR